MSKQAARRFYATIRHHSISQARHIAIMGTLAKAKRAATREFSGGFSDHDIVVLDERGEIASSRNMLNRKWTDRP